MNAPSLTRREFLRAGISLIAAGLLEACRSKAQPPSAEEPATQGPVTAQEKEPTLPALTVNVLASGLEFPEGPAFAPDGSLWCTELLGGNLVRWSPEGVDRFPTNGRPNGLAFDWKGRAWVCDSGQNAIRRFDPGTGAWEIMADSLEGIRLQSPNDLCFDAAGNLLFTCPNFVNTDPTGYVCCLRPDGVLLKVVSDLHRPNGLEIIDGGQSLVVADTYQKKLFKGGWDEGAQVWQDITDWAAVGGAIGPDGMAPGADGLLYQAIYGDGVLRVIDPQGIIVQELKLPGSNPTNAAVDPSGRFGLVVTETEKGALLSLPEIQPGIAIYDGEGYWS
jgi:gluconolactonase